MYFMSFICLPTDQLINLQLQQIGFKSSNFFLPFFLFFFVIIYLELIGLIYFLVICLPAAPTQRSLSTTQAGQPATTNRPGIKC